MHHEFVAVIEAEPDSGGAYVRIPFDLRALYGKGRLRVSATVDGAPYSGSIVNMGVKNPDGSVCYILGVTKAVRQSIGKQPGDQVLVTID